MDFGPDKGTEETRSLCVRHLAARREAATPAGALPVLTSASQTDPAKPPPGVVGESQLEQLETVPSAIWSPSSGLGDGAIGHSPEIKETRLRH